MLVIASFAVAAGSWQNFYVLSGTAAATLVGLMFVAVTFGANLVTPETATSARAFLDPTFLHFVQVLLTACLMVIPSMTAPLLGILLLGLATLRTVGLFGIYRTMKDAQEVHQDVELSDWLTGAAFPLVCYVLLGVTGGGFLAGYAMAFNGLAIVTVAMLLLGVFSAWELFVWMAVVRNRAK